MRSKGLPQPTRLVDGGLLHPTNALSLDSTLRRIDQLGVACRNDGQF